MQKTPFRFSFVRMDTWGNKMVHCPVCTWTHPLIGVRKHILRKSQERDKRHSEWLKKHGWHKGTQTPAKAKMKP